MIARTVRRDGSILLLYGPANEPSPNRKRARWHRRPNNPQGGATSTKSRRPQHADRGHDRRCEPVDGRARHGGSMRDRTMHTLYAARAAARESPFARTQRRHDPNDPDDRSSQMLFCLCSFAATEIEIVKRAQPRLPARRSRRSQAPHDGMKCFNLAG